MLESELNVEGIDLELIDLYDKNGELVRRAVPKGEKKHAGEYAKHVLIIMKTSDSPAPGEGEGQYVVQQRSLKAKYYAGKWDMTGGGVKSGEEPVEAACREVSCPDRILSHNRRQLRLPVHIGRHRLSPSRSIRVRPP